MRDYRQNPPTFYSEEERERRGGMRKGRKA